MPSTTNPLGMRGGSEGGITPGLAAVANAIVDALAEFGVEHIELPATPRARLERDPRFARSGVDVVLFTCPRERSRAEAVPRHQAEGAASLASTSITTFTFSWPTRW